MNQKRYFAAALAGAALAGVLVGCSGSGKTETAAPAAAAAALSRGVRVAIRFTQPAPAGYLDRMDPAVRQSREAEGVTFEPTRVVYPDMAAVGYYLKVGEQFFAGGPKGEFFLPKDLVVPPDVPLYKQRTDALPVGTVQIAAALQPATAPLKTVYYTAAGRVLGSAALMDGTAPASRGARPAGRKADDPCKEVPGGSRSRALDDGCGRVDCDINTNEQAAGCCYDFDVAKGRITRGGGGGDEGEGTSGEGEEGNEEGAGVDDCGTLRMTEFYGSECYQWVVGTGAHTAECWNEQAILGSLSSVSCWENHKYRYCQNMNVNEFKVENFFSDTVQVGSTVSIGVTNNTPKYDSSVSLSGGAVGSLVPSSFFEGGVVRHYDDATKRHVAVRVVTYRAPEELPDNQTEAYDTITFTANGLTETVTLRIVQKCRDTRGREVPCK